MSVHFSVLGWSKVATSGQMRPRLGEIGRGRRHDAAFYFIFYGIFQIKFACPGVI